jgi:phosphate transport system protein
MERHFDQDITEFKQHLLRMASQAESSVHLAVKALVERNDDLARQTIEEDVALDQAEIDIDEMGVQLLSKGTLATDLRLIIVGLKISHDLERVGDEATTIARRAIELSREPQLKPYVDIPRMAAMALDMLAAALEAFVQRDTIKARSVIPRDKEVDDLNRQLHRELSSFMVESPHTITRALNLMVISKSLERIADHATNIAEDVVFLYEGRDIRHQPDSPT